MPKFKRSWGEVPLSFNTYAYAMSTKIKRWFLFTYGNAQYWYVYGIFIILGKKFLYQLNHSKIHHTAHPQTFFRTRPVCVLRRRCSKFEIFARRVPMIHQPYWQKITVCYTPTNRILLRRGDICVFCLVFRAS